MQVSQRTSFDRGWRWRQAYETIEGSVGLGVEVAALLLAVLDRNIDQFLVLGLACRSENERRVGRRILQCL